MDGVAVQEGSMTIATCTALFLLSVQCIPAKSSVGIP